MELSSKSPLELSARILEINEELKRYRNLFRMYTKEIRRRCNLDRVNTGLPKVKFPCSKCYKTYKARWAMQRHTKRCDGKRSMNHSKEDITEKNTGYGAVFNTPRNVFDFPTNHEEQSIGGAILL